MSEKKVKLQNGRRRRRRGERKEKVAKWPPSLDDELECSVCLKRLDQSSKVLPCQHIFCKKCLEDILLSSKELHCPECGVVAKDRIDDLPGNILLNRILEAIINAENDEAAITTDANVPNAEREEPKEHDVLGANNMKHKLKQQQLLLACMQLHQLGVIQPGGSSQLPSQQAPIPRQQIPPQPEANSQELRRLSVLRCILSLVHACQCRDANCRLPRCQKMKQIVQHVNTCKIKTNGGCPICKQTIALCCYHAKNCEETKCDVLFCASIKGKLKQQQLQARAKQAAMLKRRISSSQQSMPTVAPSVSGSESQLSTPQVQQPLQTPMDPLQQPPQNGMMGALGQCSLQ